MSTLTLSHEVNDVARAAHRISTAADYDRLIELAVKKGEWSRSLSNCAAGTASL